MPLPAHLNSLTCSSDKPKQPIQLAPAARLQQQQQQQQQQFLLVCTVR